MSRNKSEVMPHKLQVIPTCLTQLITNSTVSNITCFDGGLYSKCLHVKGTIHFKNGNHYEGDIYYGNLHGNGMMKFPDGTKYNGQFEFNRITGKGRYDWPTGNFYEGDVLDGQQQGYGKYVCVTTNQIYEGEFNKGQREGQGLIKFSNGNLFEGQFKDGVRNGIGRIDYTNEGYYDGDFRDDKKNGHGKCSWGREEEEYEGDWINNTMDGIGELTWNDKQQQGKYLKNRYKGQFKAGKRYGIFFYANGSRVEGNWKDNCKQGEALFLNEKGLFKCIFNNDRLQAKLEITSPSVNGLIKSQYQEKELDIIKEDLKNNNYFQSLDLSDIYYQSSEYDYYSQIKVFNQLQDVCKVLLRYNRQIKNIYKNKCQQNSPNQFCMNFEGYYSLLKDASLICHNTSYVGLERLFYQGRHNRYRFDLDIMNGCKRLKTQYNDKTWLNDRDLFVRQYLENGDQVYDFFDIHDLKNVIFYRHFIELLIRTAYLKNHKSTHNINKLLEKMIENNLIPAIEELVNFQIQSIIDEVSEIDKSKLQQDQTDKKRGSILQSVSGRFNKWKEPMHQLFKKLINIRMTIFPISDQSISIKKVVQILNQLGFKDDGMETFTNIYQKYLQRPQDENNIQEKKKKKPLIKEKSKDPYEKLISIINHDINFQQYFDLLEKFFIKFSKSTKPSVVETYVNQQFQSYLEIQFLKIDDPRVKLATQKDIEQFLQLVLLKEEKKKSVKNNQKQIKNQKKKSGKKSKLQQNRLAEIRQMKEEDFDIVSQGKSEKSINQDKSDDEEKSFEDSDSDF